VAAVGEIRTEEREGHRERDMERHWPLEEVVKSGAEEEERAKGGKTWPRAKGGKTWPSKFVREWNEL
jgi:hypothetical protein